MRGGGHVLYKEKRKERRACTYSKLWSGRGHVLDREGRKERRACTYEASVKGGGACTVQIRKGKRGGYVHMNLW